MKNNALDAYILYLYRKSSHITFTEFLKTLPHGYKGMVFREVEKDPIGKSGSNPTWVSSYLYDSSKSYYNEEEITFDDETKTTKRMALYKEFDYDEPRAAYAEKIWSVLGKSILPRCRVPDIDLVYNPDNGREQVETISYRLLDKPTEDLILMSVVLDFKYANQKREMRRYCKIEELLECVKEGRYYKDEENYIQLEEDIIHATLLDCISNNGDRHPDNWGIVVNKINGEHRLALFDHSNCFRNIIMPQIGMASYNWCSTYFTLDENYKSTKYLSGENGNKIIKYIYEKYPQYVESFMKNFDDRYPLFRQELQGTQIYNDSTRTVQNIISNIYSKGKYIQKVLDGRGEIYED